jgi:hypothetical protein
MSYTQASNYAKHRLDPVWVEKYRKYKRDYARMKRATDPAYKARQKISYDKYYKKNGKNFGKNAAKDGRRGIIWGWFWKLQNGTCAIQGCSNAVDNPKTSALDHCHVTGTVRGILCFQHNTALGLFKDNPDHLRAAATYIEQWR